MLCAEGQVRHAAECVEQRHSAVRKPLRRPQAGGQRRFQHKVDAAAHGGLGATVFLHDRKVAPLNIIAAHCAHDGCIRAQRAPGFGQMVRVSRVEWVVFGNDAADGHNLAPSGQNNARI